MRELSNQSATIQVSHQQLEQSVRVGNAKKESRPLRRKTGNVYMNSDARSEYKLQYMGLAQTELDVPNFKSRAGWSRIFLELCKYFEQTKVIKSMNPNHITFAPTTIPTLIELFKIDWAPSRV